jgi:AcrR family transcriptional regulator
VTAWATIDHSAPEIGKRERNKAEKRRRIIEAASRLFLEKGFEATTTAEISAAAGVGTGTLYLYVDSKEDLLVEVFRIRVGPAWDEAFARIDPDHPLVDQLVAVFCGVADYHLEEPTLSRAYFRELMFTTGPVADAMAEFMGAFYRRLGTVLGDAQDRGRLSAEIDRRSLARNLFAGWYFLMQRHVGWDDRERVHASIERSIRTALVGIT